MASGEKSIKVLCDVATFDAKLETLSGKGEPRKVNGKPIVMKTDGSPKIVRKNLAGDTLRFTRYDKATGKVLTDSNGKSIEAGNCYVDSKDNIVPNAEIVPFYEAEDGEHIQAVKNTKTEVFEVKKWLPLKSYLDNYIVENYYVVKPSQGKSKADVQRRLTIKANTGQMKKLYDHMLSHGIVGRGTLNITSNGYMPSIAFVRPVKEPNDAKGECALEIGIFKQQKRFTHTFPENVEEYVPSTANEVIDANVPSIDEI
jgi:hypothetical protein